MRANCSAMSPLGRRLIRFPLLRIILNAAKCPLNPPHQGSLVAAAHFRRQFAFFLYRLILICALSFDRRCWRALLGSPAEQLLAAAGPRIARHDVPDCAVAVFFDAALTAVALMLHLDNTRKGLQTAITLLQATQTLALTALASAALPLEASLGDWARAELAIGGLWVASGVMVSPSQVVAPEAARAVLSCAVLLLRHALAPEGLLLGRALQVVSRSLLGFLITVVAVCLCWRGDRVRVSEPSNTTAAPCPLARISNNGAGDFSMLFSINHLQVFLPGHADTCPPLLRRLRSALLGTLVPINGGGEHMRPSFLPSV